MKYRLLTLCCGVFLCFTTAASLAQSPTTLKTLAAIGSAEMARGNVAAARAKAVTDALVAALAKAAADLLAPDGFVENFSHLNEEVFAHPQTFVENYRVLTEFKGQTHYRVWVQATVAMDRLAETLDGKITGKLAATPQRILLMIAEQQAPGAPFQGWWTGHSGSGIAESAIAGELQRKGLEIIAPAGAMNIASPLPEITDADALQIGRRLRADVVVTGAATIVPGANVLGVNTRSFQAEVKVKILRTEPAGKIGTAKQSADAVGENAAAAGIEALQNAGEAAATEIFDQIRGHGAPHQTAAEPTTVETTVSGIRGLADLVQLRRLLSQTPGVSDVRMVEIKAEDARLMVDYIDRGPKLAEVLLKRTHDAFAIRIVKAAAQKLHLELVPIE
jgi:hypothetical protein